jgi:alkylation response protein AidB-like acyl-CoA dehydrogenase
MRATDDDDDLTPEQRLLRDNVAQFLDREVRPTVPRFEQAGEFDWTLPARLRDFGYLGGFLKEEEGGYGLSYMDYAILMEEAGYCWHSLRAILNTMNMAVLLLARLGTTAQKQKYLAPLLEGKLRVWVGITEPNHGSNVAGMETRAVRDGDAWVVNGSKLWITNGAIAELGILMARVPPTAPGEPHGITAFLVDSREAEFTKKRVHTMILKATTTSELHFQDMRIPAANVLGEVGKGLKNILIALSFGRLSVAGGAVGAAQAALDLSIDYAKTRKQFGAAIGSYQLVQKMVVDMKVRTDAARQLVRRAARRLDAGRPARMECSIAKLYAAEAAHEVADLALQLHGGMGYSTDFPIERIFRDTRGAVIPEGTTEIQTLIIGRELLGLSAFGGAAAD